MKRLKTYKQLFENNIDPNLEAQLKDMGYSYVFYDNNVNEMPPEEASILHIGFYENGEDYESIFKGIKIPKKKKLDIEYVMNKLNSDKVYKNFSDNFNKILKEKLPNVSAYPTSYGIGFFALYKSSETKKQIEEILDEYGIKYTTEYSDAGYVFRYKISKSKENIEKISLIQ